MDGKRCRFIFSTSERKAIEDIFGFFNGLQEEIYDKAQQLQSLLEEKGDESLVKEFAGAYYGFLNDVEHFIQAVNRVEGKLGVVESEGSTTVVSRIAGVAGEDNEFELKIDEKIKPGNRITTLPLLERKDTVGSPYDPEFLAEECIRLARGGHAIGASYASVKEAFEALVEKDKNLSKKQVEAVKTILSKMGYKV